MWCIRVKQTKEKKKKKNPWILKEKDNGDVKKKKEKHLNEKKITSFFSHI